MVFVEVKVSVADAHFVFRFVGFFWCWCLMICFVTIVGFCCLRFVMLLLCFLCWFVCCLCFVALLVHLLWCLLVCYLFVVWFVWIYLEYCLVVLFVVSVGFGGLLIACWFVCEVNYLLYFVISWWIVGVGGCSVIDWAFVVLCSGIL